jgi:lipopolysaccharide/colanic/teichoic acid biosynthesis glycosyltransferase
MMTQAPHVIHEQFFRTIVSRERRRADRTHQPFVLLLVSARAGGGERAALWATVIEAVAAARSDTDVLGWFEWHAVLGLTVSDVHGIGLAAGCAAIEQRVRAELARRLDPATAARVSIRFHVHPAAVPEAAPAPVAYPALPAQRESGMLYEPLKRALDIVGSLVLLALLLPLFLVIAVLVKARSAGPVFYRQTRIGRGMKPFIMLKFRTMTVGADHGLHQEFVSSFINGGAAAHRRGNEMVFKLANDPRVTGIGRVLRATSLDELPQLWNVLRGDMSLVGPRPPLAYELAQYKPWHRRRLLEAKPGITGLWQVTGRSRTTFDEMVRLDLRYARTRSLWTDVRILVATPAAVISGRGAC